jgi:predicted dehydrogenase
MLGMVEENGHPLSWSAIINGRFDGAVIRTLGYPMIADYLEARPSAELGISAAEITHVWCDRRSDAIAIAQSAGIGQIVDQPTDVIGHVDAVIIPTDKGAEHLERARPFVEAGLPIFVDKPLATSVGDLKQFVSWHKAGKQIYSSSAMRYAAEFIELRNRLHEVGEPRLIVATCAKSWERYGIHAIESIHGLLPSGEWEDVINTGDEAANIVHIRHKRAVDVVIAVNHDMFGGFCHVTIYGTTGRLDARFRDSFTAFKRQLQAFVKAIQGDPSDCQPTTTHEQMAVLIAAIESREQGGRRIQVSSVLRDDLSRDSTPQRPCQLDWLIHGDGP